jgi:DNA-binding NtrC family response regulator
LKRSVFYFDDEATTLNLFREMFGHEYDVRVTTSLAEARRMLSEQPTDIIISDQEMPEISGMKFLSEVAQTYPSSYRIMLTGSMLAGEALPKIMSGIVQLFITKPWNKHTMQQMLERACAQIDLNRDKA